MLSEQQKKANVRTALILASISLALLIGFVVNMAWMH
ncbi:cytochrome oxidase small assembly protein [Comamonas faecalis]